MKILINFEWNLIFFYAYFAVILSMLEQVVNIINLLAHDRMCTKMLA